MKLNDLDRAVIKALVSGRTLTQEQIAVEINTDLRKVRDSLSRLNKGGLVDLNRSGQRQIPRLRLFTVLEEVQSALGDLLTGAASPTDSALLRKSNRSTLR